MNETLEDVRRDIENTRLSIGNKISRLEQRIETTKNTTLNPAYHVKKRPWPTLGIFMTLGWFVGRRLKKNKSVVSRARLNGAVSRPPHFVGELGSALANAMGVIAGDIIRDFIKKRRIKHST